MLKYLVLLIVSIMIIPSCSSFNSPENEKIIPPTLKKDSKLMYPISAQKNNREGNALVVINIGKDGLVHEIEVRKSSGHKDLDYAAKNYCKNLIFTPAKYNDEPISSRLKWRVKFNLKDVETSLKKEIKSVLSWYKKISFLEGEAKERLQQNILNQHLNIVEKTRDGEKLNKYIYSVITKELASEWIQITDDYSLTFLLYHDFAIRYKDYNNMSYLQNLIIHSINLDLDFINNDNQNEKSNRKALANKIEWFIKEKYPYFEKNNSMLNKIQNNLVSFK